MQSEPIAFRLRVTIGLLVALLFVTLALFKAALLGGRSDFDFVRSSALPYVVVANLVGLAWGFWLASRVKTPSDLRVVLIWLSIGLSIATLTFVLI